MITMFAACCLLLPGTSGAQGPVPAPVAAVASDPVEAPKLLSFSFAGGTLREFAAALRTAAPDANVLLAQGAADVSVQAFELRNVELQQVLRVACELAAPDSVVSFQEVRAKEQGSASVVVLKARSGSRTTRARRGSERHGASEGARPLVMCLQELTTGHGIDKGTKPEDVLTAIDAALVGQPSKPEVEFLAETRMLIARGGVEPLRIVKDVVDQLRDARAKRAARWRSKRAGEGKDQK